MSTDRPNRTAVSGAIAEAQSIVEAAKRRAAELDAESEKIRAQAREAGYDEGFGQGLADASQAAVRLIEQTQMIGERLSEEAARLALAICSSIIGEQVRVDPNTVGKIARRALQESIVGDTVSIVVNPDDQHAIAAAQPDLKKISGGAQVSIEIDPSIARGGCIIRTEFGEVDATIEALVESVAVRLGVSRHG